MPRPHPHLDGRAPARSGDVDLASRRGEAGGVLDEVREDLSDLDGFGVDRRKIRADRRSDDDAFQGASQPLEHRANHLVDQHRLRRWNQCPRTHPCEIQEVADDQVQVIGFLDHRAEDIPPLLVAVVGALGEKTGCARLDGCERRSEVVGDGGEESGPESVRFHLEPSLPDLAVQGRPFDRERGLRGERLQQAELGWGERLLARARTRSARRRNPTCDERDRDRCTVGSLPFSPASARPTPFGVAISPLASPKKLRSDSASPSRIRPKGSLEMKRSVVRLRRSASVARCSARERSSRTLLTRAPTMSADRRNAIGRRRRMRAGRRGCGAAP